MGYEVAKLKKEGSKEMIEVMFNPSEYNISSAVNYADIKNVGTDKSISQFSYGQSDVLKLSLFFDTYIPAGVKSDTEDGTDVRIETSKISNMIKVDADKHRPPKVTFYYGSFEFSGIITDISQTFTMFLPNGKPVRCKMELTLKSDEAEDIPLESPDRTKSRKLHQNQQLWSLAWEEYKNPEFWKIIAKENKIMNPLDLYAGQILKLPAINK